MSKKKITFIAEAEDGVPITHGGVVFVPGQPVTVDADEVQLSPFFLGNPSFTVEDANETTENQPVGNDDHAGAGDRGVSQNADQKREERPAAKVTATRSRRKAVAK